MGVIAKQSIKGTVVTYLGVFVGFLTTFFVLTRFLTAEEIGLARVLIDTATLFIGLAQLGATSSIIRFFPYFKNEKEHNGFFFFALIFPLLGFLIFALLYVLLHHTLQNVFIEKSPLFIDYYYFVLPLSFFMLYQTVFETCSNVQMRIVFPRSVRELWSRVMLLVVYLLYAFHIISLDGFVIALCVSYAIAALLNMIYFVSDKNFSWKSLVPNFTFLRNNPVIIRRYLLYTGFLVLSAVASVLAPSISSFFLTAQKGLDFTGIFAIATYIAVMVSIPYRSMTAIASPQLAAAIKEHDQRQIKQLTTQVSANLFLVGTLILCAIWINIDLIFYVLPNGEIYSVARYAVLLLALSQLLLATFNISLNTLNYSRHYYWSLVLSFILTMLAIFFNKLFIPLLGINGAALANLLSYLIYFVLVLIVVYFSSHTTPLSVSHLKTLTVGSAVLAINELWLHYMPMDNIWLSSVVRTFFLIGSACFFAYYWRISTEINALLRSRIKYLPKR